ncbi:MAG: DNA-binding protein Fis [Syntrophaceae bacterium PtaU1.Bin231]|jgi:DNA-binding protein Fis|nr:MAG: DNA-binding protein Fis [Syntrophaceae bacterium PtaU1.Bin231]
MVIQQFSNILKNRIESIIDSQSTWGKEDIKSQILKVFADVTDMYIAALKQNGNSTLKSRPLTVLEDTERRKIVQMLLLTFGNKNRTARALGMNRDILRDKMRQYGIEYP